MPDTSLEQHTAAIAAIEAFMGYASTDGMIVRLTREQYIYNYEDFRLHYMGQPLPFGVAVRVLAQFASHRLDEHGMSLTDLRHTGNFMWSARVVPQQRNIQQDLVVKVESQPYESALASLILHTRCLLTTI